MPFWSNQATEPLRQYRWYVLFGTDLGGIRYALKKIDKPKAKIGEITHSYLNHKFYYPGRLEWEAINMTFASVQNPDAAATLMKAIREAGYGVPSDNFSEESLSSIGKRKFSSAIGELSIFQVNADGADIERWQLKRPFFTSVQFGSLDYASEEIVEIQCTVRYDWAEFNNNVVDTVGLGVDEGDAGPNPGFPS